MTRVLAVLALFAAGCVAASEPAPPPSLGGCQQGPIYEHSRCPADDVEADCANGTTALPDPPCELTTSYVGPAGTYWTVYCCP